MFLVTGEGLLRRARTVSICKFSSVHDLQYDPTTGVTRYYAGPKTAHDVIIIQRPAVTDCEHFGYFGFKLALSRMHMRSFFVKQVPEMSLKGQKTE